MATFTDDFNRADSTNLGANWVEVSGDWSIISNRLSSGSAGGTIILRAAGVMATSDHSAQVTIAATAAVSQGVWCRGNSNITSGYLWRNDGVSWNLFSVVGGSFTSIGSFAGAAVAGDVAKVQAVGSTIKGFVNGVQRVSVADTNVATGTSVGLRAESVSALRFDDFTAADVVTGSTGDAALSGAATLSASGLRATAGAAALTATAGLTAAGARGMSAAAFWLATASLTADGSVATVGVGNVTAAASLSAAGLVDHPGSASLAATAALAAAGQVERAGQADLAVDATLTASGVRGAQGDTGLSAAAALVAQGLVGHSTDAALAGTAVLTADGTTGTPPMFGAAVLNATVALTASGVRGTTAGLALGATAQLTAAGATTFTGSAALVATATLTASGAVLVSGDDVDVTVGAPFSPWSAGQPYMPAWTLRTPQANDWEVGAPC